MNTPVVIIFRPIEGEGRCNHRDPRHRNLPGWGSMCSCMLGAQKRWVPCRGVGRQIPHGGYGRRAALFAGALAFLGRQAQAADFWFCFLTCTASQSSLQFLRLWRATCTPAWAAPGLWASGNYWKHSSLLVAGIQLVVASHTAHLCSWGPAWELPQPLFSVPRTTGVLQKRGSPFTRFLFWVQGKEWGYYEGTHIAPGLTRHLHTSTTPWLPSPWLDPGFSFHIKSHCWCE